MATNISESRSLTDTVTNSNNDSRYWQSNRSLYPVVDHIRPGYRRSVCGAHLIYYRIDAQSVEIVRILKHQDPSKELSGMLVLLAATARRFPSKNDPACRMAKRPDRGKILKESSWRPHFSLIAELICNQ